MADSLRNLKSPQELIDKYFLDIRCAILETAALFDRVERCENGAEVIKNDEKLKQLKDACLLAIESSESTNGSRVENILRMLSDD